MVKKRSKNVKKKIKKKESIEKDEEMNNDKSEVLFVSKDIDLQKVSKEIDKELSQNIISPQKEILSKEIIISPSEKKGESLYQKLLNQYIKNNFNINIISMITQLINTSKTLPKELKNNYPLNNMLLDITKELMFSDLEIVYFSLFLDNFGWTNEYYDVKDNLIITGLCVKKYLNKDIDIIENHLDKNYEQIYEKFNNWINSQNDFKKNISFSPIIVNERNNLLKKPFNCYCRNNYIDYNDAVDKILQLSLPYNEINKHAKNYKKNKNGDETNIYDLQYGQQIDTNELNSYKIIPLLTPNSDKINNKNYKEDQNYISPKGFKGNNINLKEINKNNSSFYNNKIINKNSEEINFNTLKFDKNDTQNFSQKFEFNDYIPQKDFSFNSLNKFGEQSFFKVNNLNLAKNPSNNSSI